MQSEKQKQKRAAKRKQLKAANTQTRIARNGQRKAAKSRYQQIKEQRHAEAKILSYILHSVGVDISQDREMDAVELKGHCQKFIDTCQGVEEYEAVKQYAEKKMAQIDLMIAQSEQLRGLRRNRITETKAE